MFKIGNIKIMNHFFNLTEYLIAKPNSPGKSEIV